MDLLKEYIEAIYEIERINSEPLKWNTVRRNNRFADKVHKIALKIDTKYPELKEDYFQLLYHENAEVRGWTAYRVAETMHYDNEHRKCALDHIISVAVSDDRKRSTNAKFWLRYWLQKHPEDMELIEDKPAVSEILK